MSRSKSISATVITLVFLAVAYPAALAQKSDLETTLVSTERQLWDAWKNKDAATFEKTLAPDAVTMGDKGLEDRTTSIKDIASGNCQVQSYTLSDTKVTQIDKDSALLTYKANQDAVCDGKKIPAVVYASTLYEKHGDKWMPAFHQESVVPESQRGSSMPQ
jgi:hypothetical protein